MALWNYGKTRNSLRPASMRVLSEMLARFKGTGRIKDFEHLNESDVSKFGAGM